SAVRQGAVQRGSGIQWDDSPPSQTSASPKLVCNHGVSSKRQHRVNDPCRIRPSAIKESYRPFLTPRWYSCGDGMADPIDGIKLRGMTLANHNSLAQRRRSFSWAASASDAFNWQAYAATLAMVGGAVIIGMILRQFLASPNISLVFLTAVLASAVA